MTEKLSAVKGMLMHSSIKGARSLWTVSWSAERWKVCQPLLNGSVISQVPPHWAWKKTLFDIEVSIDGEDGHVLPDFIVMVTLKDGKESKVVIETMGYTDDDYCDRKAEQHKAMRQIGILQIDPPRWPQELKTSL